MQKTEGKNWIKGFRIKLIVLYLLQAFFLSLALGLLMVPVARYMGFNSFLIASLVFLLIFCGTLLFKPTWKITLLEVANYLNAKFLNLEESATLFLKSPHDLSLLEKLQIEKISPLFPIPHSLSKPLKQLWLSLIFLIVCAGAVVFLPAYLPQIKTPHPLKIGKENVPTELSNFTLNITPPAYTRRTSRLQQQFTIKAEIGSLVIWTIKTTSSVKKLQLIFNDKEIITLDASGKFSKIINQPGFYQLELDGKRSDLYPIEVIPDLPVSIKINTPKPHTTIDIGALPKVNLGVSLTDDYGINHAYILATLSSGKGEGVSFTEKKIPFDTNFRGLRTVKLTKLLDLTALGMKPGDELYFFINATDNNNQISRSDVYSITIVDPTELLSMAGMTNGVDLIPEYFRSQRQIIIDTEKLLKEQTILDPNEFKNRSNALGMDQKLLRLRYGKFLGEESETGIGGEHDHEEGDNHTEPAFGDVKAIMDEYAHKHDIAEDATFFEPELKMQLKAVLNEMWSSELQLRINKPKDALPFEYKALRLLKDLQQKSRAYVAKTTIKTAKLKLEKRLTGELDKIGQPKQQSTFEPTNQSNEELKLVLAVLEQQNFKYGDRELLRAGEKHLIAAAANQPSTYLAALKSIRKLNASTYPSKLDVALVQKAIQQVLGIENLKPQRPIATPEANLYRSYFNHLKNGN